MRRPCHISFTSQLIRCFFTLLKYALLLPVSVVYSISQCNGACTQTATATASSFSDDASNGGVRTWTNPSNASASDNSRATASALIIGQKTHYLRAQNFGFSIPATSTICGLEITIEKSATGFLQNVVDDEVKIIKNGTISGTNLGFDDVWGTSDAIAVHGNTYETCGLSWTAADINASNFGVAISVNLGGIAVLPGARIDFISITVHYTYSALPIQLLNFTAQCLKQGIELHWATASELNNKQYTIQSSADGSTWNNLDSLPGAGTSDVIQNYNWMDANPAGQLCYYRLCQSDYDGTQSCFVPLAIRSNCFATDDELLIYPNPVLEKVCFRYTAKNNTDAKVEIANLEGKTVLQSEIQITKGLNTYCYSTSGFKSGGYYFLKLILDRNSVTAKFIR